jgi:antitoxin-like ribbon-helix-helix protein
MGKSKFGGDKYKPHHLGPEPASPHVAPAEPAAPVLALESPSAKAAAPQPSEPEPRAAQPALTPPPASTVPDIKVPYSSRISYAADLQLKALAKEGHTQVDLLAEALNLLFKKYGVAEVA